MTWAKNRWPAYGDLARYWVVCAAGLAVLWVATTGYVPFSKRQPQTTADNIEANVRKWADSLGLGITRMPQQSLPTGQRLYFGIVVTLTNKNPLSVFRSEEKPGYLQIQCPLVLSPEHLAMLDKLTKDEADAATQEVLLELARTKVGFTMATATGPLQQGGAEPATTQPIVLQQTIILMKGVPIGNDLTEATFAQYLNEIDSAVLLVRASTALTLQRYSRLHDARIAQPGQH